MNNDPRLYPFQGIRVGGQKTVATAQDPIQGDNTGSSNLQDLVQSNFGGQAPNQNGSVQQSVDQSNTGIGCKSGLRTLKGELIACCGAGIKPQEIHRDEDISSNLPYKGPSPVQMNVVESLHEDTQEDAIEDLRKIEQANKKDSNRDPNKFTQYGGWTTEGLGD
jgi:hypothetical protein